MAFNYSPKIVTDGLVLALDAANPKSYVSGSTTWGDLSRGGNNGTLVNGPTFDSGNGGSIVFDGVNDYVDVADTPFRFSNTFSISFWFYWNGVNQFANILGKRNEVSPFNQYVFSFNESPYTGGSSNKLTFFARRDGGAVGTDILLQYPLPSSGFYNATVIMSPSNQSLYVNNILRSSSSTDISTFTYNIINKNLWIGSSFGSNIYFTGNIPQVSIYNRALSAQEILQNYNATKTRFGL
jgi:hypothetical protein